MAGYWLRAGGIVHLVLVHSDRTQSEPIPPMRYAGLGLSVVGDVCVGASSLVFAFDGGEAWKGELPFLCASLTWSVPAITALAAVWA